LQSTTDDEFLHRSLQSAFCFHFPLWFVYHQTLLFFKYLHPRDTVCLPHFAHPPFGSVQRQLCEANPHPQFPVAISQSQAETEWVCWIWPEQRGDHKLSGRPEAMKRRAVVHFVSRRCLSPAAFKAELTSVYDNERRCWPTVYKWHRRFPERETELCDDMWSRRRFYNELSLVFASSAFVQ
jgi:hypothetical protein